MGNVRSLHDVAHISKSKLREERLLATDYANGISTDQSRCRRKQEFLLRFCLDAEGDLGSDSQGISHISNVLIHFNDNLTIYQKCT